jgi:hypothetical protein
MVHQQLFAAFPKHAFAAFSNKSAGEERLHLAGVTQMSVGASPAQFLPSQSLTASSLSGSDNQTLTDILKALSDFNFLKHVVSMCAYLHLLQQEQKCTCLGSVVDSRCPGDDILRNSLLESSFAFLPLDNVVFIHNWNMSLSLTWRRQ